MALKFTTAVNLKCKYEYGVTKEAVIKGLVQFGQ